MTKEELLKKQDAWWVLQKIKDSIKKNSNQEKVSFLIHLLNKDQGAPAPESQFQALLNLQSDKALRFRKPDDDGVVIIGIEEYVLEIFQQKFNQAYASYTEIFNERKEKLLCSIKEPETSTNKKNETPPLLKERLQRKINSFINLGDIGFFRGTADYVKSIDESSLLSEIVKNHIWTE